VPPQTLRADQPFQDGDAYTRHNEAFHHAIVAMADNPTLIDAYQRLGVAGVMVSLLKGGIRRRSPTVSTGGA